MNYEPQKDNTRSLSSTETELHEAASRWRDSSTIKYLARKSENLNARNNEGLTALHLAEKKGFTYTADAIREVYLEKNQLPLLPEGDAWVTRLLEALAIKNQEPDAGIALAGMQAFLLENIDEFYKQLQHLYRLNPNTASIEKIKDLTCKNIVGNIKSNRRTLEDQFAYKKLSVNSYTNEEMHQYFETLESVFSKREIKTIALVMRRPGHILSIGLCPKQGLWTLVSSKKLNISSKQLSTKEIVEILLELIRHEGFLAFSAEIYALHTDTGSLEEGIADLKLNQTWVKIQKINKRRTLLCYRSLLCWASYIGHIAELTALLEHFPYPQKCDLQEALYMASQCNQLETSKILLEHGASPCGKISYYNNNSIAFNVAVENGHTDIVELFIKYIPNIIALIINSTNKYEFPLIERAVRSGNVKLVQLFLQHGLDLHECCLNGDTLLYYAAEQGHIDILVLLLQQKVDIHKTDIYEATPLHVACNEDILITLLEYGADPNYLDYKGNTPLKTAIQRGCINSVKALLRWGADPTIASHDGETTLHRAAYFGYLEIVQLLVDRNVNINAIFNNNTPLSLAQEKKHINIVNYLKAVHLKRKIAILLPTGQQWMIDHMQLLGYQDQRGLCGGISIIAAEMFLEGKLETFRRILQEIYCVCSEHYSDILTNNKEHMHFIQKLYLYQNASDKKEWLLRKTGKNTEFLCSGVYNQAELEIFLTKLEQYFLTEIKHFCLIMCSIGHAITITFNAAKKEWAVIDANNLIWCHNEATANEVASKIINAFTDKNLAIFNTKICTNEEDTATLLKIIYQLKSDNEWKDIHRVTPSKAKFSDDPDAKWLHLSLLDSNDAGTLMSLLTYSTNMHEENKFWRKPLLSLAVLAENIKAVEILLVNGANPNIGTPYSTPLQDAILTGNILIVETLLKNGANIHEHPTKTINLPIHTAVLHRHMNIVKLLLQWKANTSIKGGDWKTPLEIARENGYKEIADLLLEYEGKFEWDIKKEASLTDLGITESNNIQSSHTTLCLAVRSNDIENIKSLLEDRADPNGSCCTKTPLIIAVELGHLEIVKLLLSYKADPNELSRACGFVYSTYAPLHIACEKGFLEITKALVEAGADTTIIAPYDGKTPLYFSERYGHDLISEYLISIATKKHQKLQLPSGQRWIINRLEFFWPLLEGVCTGISLVAAEYFLSGKIDSFIDFLHKMYALNKTNLAGSIEKDATITSLCNKIYSYQYNLVFFFQENSNKLLIKNLCSGVYSPHELKELLSLLENIFATKEIELVSFILSDSKHRIHLGLNANQQHWVINDANHLKWCDKKIPLTQFSDELLSLLSSAFIKDNTFILKTEVLVNKNHAELLNKKIDILFPDNKWLNIHRVCREKALKRGYRDQTWLHLAVLSGSEALVEKLLQHGANPNSEDYDGCTPLHQAVRSDKEENAQIINMLLEHRANPDKTGENNISILCKAIVLNKMETIKLLLKHYANPNLSYKEGIPLHKAIMNGNVDAVKLLLVYGADPDQANESGVTPLMMIASDLTIASKENSLEIVNILLHHDANIFKKDNNGQSALYYALKRQCLEVVKKLSSSITAPQRTNEENELMQKYLIN